MRHVHILRSKTLFKRSVPMTPKALCNAATGKEHGKFGYIWAFVEVCVTEISMKVETIV